MTSPIKAAPAEGGKRKPPIIVRNKDTDAVVNRYKTMAAARAHVASFPNDYIARATGEQK